MWFLHKSNYKHIQAAYEKLVDSENACRILKSKEKGGCLPADTLVDI